MSDRALTGTPARLLVAAAFAAALFSAGTRHGDAASKGAPSPSPSPAATPAPTPTPEPLNLAIPRLEGVLKANPTDYAAMTQLASSYLEAQRPDLAIGLTTKLIAAGRKTGQVYFLDGASNEQLGRIKEATASLEQAANYEPTNPQVLLTLTDLYLRTNRAADADRVAKRATTFNKDDPRTLQTYGLVLAQENKYDDARAQFELAAKADPKSALPLTLIGRSYLDQKAFPNAIAAFDRALAVDPKSVEAFQGKAAAYLGQNDTKSAIATYEQIYSIAPDDISKIGVLAAEARIYATAKDLTNAEAILKRAVTEFPANPQSHIEYGTFLASQNKSKEALAEWQIAAGPNNDNREALMLIGSFDLAQGQKTQAIASFKRITDTHPGDAEALLRLAQAYAANQQYGDARDAYRRSFEVSQSVQALAGIGVSDCATRNFKEGTQILDALENRAPGFSKANPQMYLMMGKCYTDAGQKQKARTSYSKLLAFVKPGSSEQSQLKKLIADLDKSTAPKASAAPKPSPAPKH